MKYVNIILSVLLICSILGVYFSAFDFMDFVNDHDNGLYDLGASLYSLLPLERQRYKNGFTLSEMNYYEFCLHSACYISIEEYNSTTYYVPYAATTYGTCIPYIYQNGSVNFVNMEAEEALWHYYAYTYLPTWLDEYHRGEYIDVPAIDIFLKKYCTVDWKEFEAGSEPLRYLHFNWPKFQGTYFYFGDYTERADYTGYYWYYNRDLDLVYELIQFRIDLLVNSDITDNVDINKYEGAKYLGGVSGVKIAVGEFSNYFKDSKGNFRVPDYLLYKIHSSYHVDLVFDIYYYKIMKEIPIYDYTLPY